MKRLVGIVGLVGALACLMTGCGRHQHTAASMGMVRADGVVSLGAGDALGRAIYVNDLILAARNVPSDLVVTAVTEQ